MSADGGHLETCHDHPIATCWNQVFPTTRSRKETDHAKVFEQPHRAGRGHEARTDRPTCTGRTERHEGETVPELSESRRRQGRLRDGSAEQGNAGVVVHESEDA